MKKKNIILIQPLGKSVRLTETHHLDYFDKEPYTLEHLEAYLKINGFAPELASNYLTEAELLRIIERSRPLAVGFSTYTYSFNKSIQLAKAVKQKAVELGYNIFTVFGGYHASALPKETASLPEVDFVIKGEGEITLLELLNALKENKCPSKIPGLFFKQNGKVIQTPERKRIENLDSLPFPERHYEIIKNQKNPRITYPPPSEQKSVACISYSRACPFNCYFCSSRNLWGNKMTFRSTESVISEMEVIVKKYGTNFVMFTDLSFNANRKKAMELCHKLIKKDLPVFWTSTARIDLLDEEFIKLAKEAKCTKLQIGIESFNKDLSTKIKDKYKFNKDRMIKMLDFTNELGIIIRAFLIIGFENDTKDLIRSYKDEVLKLPIDELGITFATPLPGSCFWDDSIKKNLISKNSNFDNFTTEDPVLNIPNLSKNDLFVLRKEIGGHFVSPQYFDHVKNKIIKFPHLKNSWIEGYKIYEAMGVFKGLEKELDNFISNVKQLGLNEKK